MISSLENTRNFIQGFSYSYLYYSKSFGRLLSKCIREQIQYRFSGLGKECIESNTCQEADCGCDLSKQVMSNKLCYGSCRYDKFMSEEEWEKFKENNETEQRICIGKTLL